MIASTAVLDDDSWMYFENLFERVMFVLLGVCSIQSPGSSPLKPYMKPDPILTR